MEEAELLAAKMEEGAHSQGCGASKKLEKAANGRTSPAHNGFSHMS